MILMLSVSGMSHAGKIHRVVKCDNIDIQGSLVKGVQI